MLDRRKSTILRAIVRDYIKTGHPVASTNLGLKYKIKVSAATIRNEMASIEDEGFIEQPHTSAGRVPTDRGYRWFIDNWPEAKWPRLNESEQNKIGRLTKRRFRGLADALDSSTQTLSDLTSSVAVVVAPPSRKNRLKRLELLKRSDDRATLLLIADTGVVEQGLIDLKPNRNEGQLTKLAQDLTDKLDGVAFEDLPDAVAKSNLPKEQKQTLSAEIEKMFGGRSGPQVFRGGTANILMPEKFPDISAAHRVIEALERPSILRRLLAVLQEASGVQVLVGSEVPVEQMKECGIVFARFEGGTERQGIIGVIGPMRLDYPHTISTVDEMAQSVAKVVDSLSVG